MNYLLSIFVPPNFFNEAAANRCLDAIGSLTLSPSKILVVDHTSSSIAMSERRKKFKALENQQKKKEFYDKQEKTRHGHLKPRFEPLKILHSIADEVRCSNDWMLEKENDWFKSLQFKKYSILKAAEYNLDAVLMIKFPDVLSTNAAEALLKHLKENPQVSFTYLPIILGNRSGEIDTRGGIKIEKHPGLAKEFHPSNKITEKGYMIRIDSLNLGEIEQIKRGEEPELILFEALKGGYGQGIIQFKGENTYYIKVPENQLKREIKKNKSEKVLSKIIEKEIEESNKDLIKYREKKEHKK